MKSKSRLIIKILVISLGVVVLICLLGVSFLAISNRNLPTASAQPERLGENEKALIYEALYLKRTLGDNVWPGWSRADIPMIVFNEEYAFLVNYPDPPAGWEPVPDDDFFGQIYYRQKLAGEAQSPQNFVVRVAGSAGWAA